LIHFYKRMRRVFEVVFGLLISLSLLSPTGGARRLRKRLLANNKDTSPVITHSKEDVDRSKRFWSQGLGGTGANLGASGAAQSYRFLNPFSLFSIVNFPNSGCVGNSGIDGTCYTASQCSSRGGSSDGSCAAGFGTCCTFSAPCDSETTQNGTYFSSPESIPTVCSLMISPMSEDICQVRLNFEEVELLDPDSTGACRTDYMHVTGGVSQTLPTLCGSLTGQHIIYSAIPNFPARLSIVTGSQDVAALTRKWRIQILQYECNHPAIAPEGCLQYYTGISGNVSSFNWKLEDNRLDTATPATFSNHLANLDYSVCVRREAGYCGIEWGTPSPATAQLGHFSVSGKLTTGATELAVADIKTGDTDCKEDYVLIPGGTGGTDPTSLPRDRFCGQALGYCPDAACSASELGPVISTVTPFSIGVFTDNTEVSGTDDLNRGFRLNYRQQPCS